MSKILVLLVLVAGLAAMVGCRTQQSGSREFIPGQGWVPTE